MNMASHLGRVDAVQAQFVHALGIDAGACDKNQFVDVEGSATGSRSTDDGAAVGMTDHHVVRRRTVMRGS